MRKQIMALVASAAVSFSGSAMAAPTIVYSMQPDGSFTAFFGNTPKQATFTDLFTSFVITNPRGGLLTGNFGTNGISDVNDLDFITGEILGPAGFVAPFAITTSALTGKVGKLTVTNPDAIENGTLSGVNLDAGTYTLRITGKTIGTKSLASYGGSLQFVATPAPEPAAWGLMILGFGAIGFTMRRARRQHARLARVTG